MADTELETLQQRAGEYLNARELGMSPEFPVELVRRLLYAGAYDGWAVGLYLLQVLDQVQIAEFFHDDRDCYGPLSTFYACRLFDEAGSGEQRLLGDDQPDAGRLQETLRAPPELAEQVLASFQAMRARDASPRAGARTLATGAPLALIVHGTWATTEDWWQPQIGDFWQHIKPQWPHLYDGTAPYWWSGADNHQARMNAARDLLRWARLSGAGELDIIAHSHGGNVCLAAAELGLSINRLYLLGTPIRTQYMPRLDNIKRIRNIFSISDWVQIPGAKPHTRGEGRTLGDSGEVSNHRATRNAKGRGPGHSELHEPATWQASGLDALLT